MRIFATNESVEVYARVGGRPLGLAFDKDRNLIVCEPLKGILYFFIPSPFTSFLFIIVSFILLVLQHFPLFFYYCY